MNNDMKARAIALILICCAFFAKAQEEKSLSILMNQADTTFRIMEVTTVDGDTTQIRFYPNSWLPRHLFYQYLYRSAVDAERRAEDLRLERQRTLDRAAFMAGTLDTIFGDSTYYRARAEEIARTLVGSYRLKQVTPDTTRFYDFTIEPDSTGQVVWRRGKNKTGTLEVVPPRTVVIEGLANQPLEFTIYSSGRLVAVLGQRRWVLRPQ